MFILIDTSSGLGIIARWGPRQISMVLRSEECLKSEMLSLARTSKYVKNTSVLSKHQQVRGGQLRPNGLTKLDSYCRDKLIFMLSIR